MRGNSEAIQIIADHREVNSGVIPMLASLDNIAVRIEHLPLGDYQADNRLIFERKTLKDFATSIIDGRLFDQMIRLAESHNRGILILEGTGKDLANSGMSRESIQGALITTSLLLGIPLLRSREPEETARLIRYAACQVRSYGRVGLKRHGRRPKDKSRRQLFILQGLPGIGREKAARLLQKFGSVEAVFRAGPDELRKVDGIGRNLAEGIRAAVKEDVEFYGFDDDFPI